MSRLFAGLVLLFGLSTAVAAPPETRNPTVALQPAADAELPPLPAGWETVKTPFVHFHGPSEDTEVLLRLSRHASEQVPLLAKELGVGLGETMHVYLADSHQRFRDLQPHRAPTWADGVAYPRLGMILLRSPSIRGGQAQPLETVLRHELVHILLGRTFAPNVPPSWLQEGLAQVHAGELTPEVAKTLANGMAAGQLMSLNGLSRGFPDDPVLARLAYAQSADFLAWFEDTYGDEGVRTLIHELAAGTSIEGSIHAATGDFIEDVDRAWRQRLVDGGLAFGALANMDWLMGLGGIVLVIGGIARRRRFHERLEEMEREEAALEALLGSYLDERARRAS